MVAQLPYCGAPPAPEVLLTRFNFDRVLIASLLILAIAHVASLRGVDARRQRGIAVLGWGVTAAALISPLCALSVSLFAARVAQHMLLALVAAPLIALALPRREMQPLPLWMAVTGFALALWFWHMPRPYEATFESTTAYWSMHVTLFGSAIALWRGLLRPAAGLVGIIVGGTVTSMQMGLLGAVLACAGRPLYFWHLTTTQAWGLTPLQDQQLGGIFMWVPGIALFLWVAVRTVAMIRPPIVPANEA